MPDRKLNVALTARQSKTEDEDSPSCETQIEDLRAFAQAKHWSITGTYIDLDAPAGNLEKRERWLDCLEDASGGGVDVIAAWDTSRLWRSVEMKILTFKELRASGVSYVATLSGIWPTDPEVDPEGNFTSTVLAAASELENTLRTLKSRRGKLRQARAGQPSGGQRPWGYVDWQRSAIDEHEAALIIECIRMRLDGKSYSTIAAWLNQAGHTTPRGNAWRQNTVKAALLRPSLAGWRVHKGTSFRQAAWEPITDTDTQERLKAMDDTLPGHGRRGSKRRGKYLLSGLLVCGRCDYVLYSGAARPGTRFYLCAKGSDRSRGACGRLGIHAAYTEDEITAQVLSVIDDADRLERYIRAAASDDAEIAQASRTLADLQQRRTGAGRRLARGADPAVEEAFLAELDAQEAQARRVLEHARASGIGLLIEAARDPRTWWGATEDIDVRRTVLRTLIRQIRVLPARNAGRFDPDRLVPDWRA